MDLRVIQVGLRWHDVPELPDITIYCESLATRVVGEPLRRLAIFSPSLLRTVEPPIDELMGRRVCAIERIGKRIVFAFEGDHFVVLHLMISGRLQWRQQAAAVSPGRSKGLLAGFQFSGGDLMLTEASKNKRASLHVIQGRKALHEFDAGGLDVLMCSLQDFTARMTQQNHTLKRSLTTPRLIDGIGNAYSDEILHRAKLSPLMWTSRLNGEQWVRLLGACRETLVDSTDRLRRQFAGRFPKPSEITAFRPEFAVHGKFGQPCPVCGRKVQRIRYADNETNYCPGCQTNGKILSDRSLARLLKDDWPRHAEEAE